MKLVVAVHNAGKRHHRLGDWHHGYGSHDAEFHSQVFHFLCDKLTGWHDIEEHFPGIATYLPRCWQRLAHRLLGTQSSERAVGGGSVEGGKYDGDSGVLHGWIQCEEIMSEMGFGITVAFRSWKTTISSLLSNFATTFTKHYLICIVSISLLFFNLWLVNRIRLLQFLHCTRDWPVSDIDP